MKKSEVNVMSEDNSLSKFVIGTVTKTKFKVSVTKFATVILEAKDEADALHKAMGMDLTDKLMAYENGQLNEKQTVKLFSHLIKTGTGYKLQGSYGRACQYFIDNRIIDENGDIFKR